MKAQPFVEPAPLVRAAGAKPRQPFSDPGNYLGCLKLKTSKHTLLSSKALVLGRPVVRHNAPKARRGPSSPVPPRVFGAPVFVLHVVF